MNHSENCNACPKRFLCHCLRLTESAIRNALAKEQTKNIRDIIQRTGAGSGCTACHKSLKQFVV